MEFLNCNGLEELLGVIDEVTGNALAYALTGVQNLMERPYGWSTLSSSFILRVVQILSSPTSPINVCRPATAILKKLVEADPSNATSPSTSSSGEALRYGFSVVFEQMRKERGFLETVVGRLGSADTAMAQYRCVFIKSDSGPDETNNRNSMNLINAMLSHVIDDPRWEEFINELERLNVRKAVIVSSCLLYRGSSVTIIQQRLMSLAEIEELTSCILDFQSNIVNVTIKKKDTPVDPEADATHVLALNAVWDASRLEEEYDEDGHPLKWRKLGFETEDVQYEFRDVGLLGLDCLVSSCPKLHSIFLVPLGSAQKYTKLLTMWMRHTQRSFVELDSDFSMVSWLTICYPTEAYILMIAQLMLEQLSRPAEKRCPIAKASNEVVELLLNHWAAFAPGCKWLTSWLHFRAQRNVVFAQIRLRQLSSRFSWNSRGCTRLRRTSL